MNVAVNIPASLRQFSGGQRLLELEVELSGDGTVTLGDVFDRLLRVAPGVVERALDEQGSIRAHVNVFVDGESVRASRGLHTPVAAGAEIWILPAVSGGS